MKETPVSNLERAFILAALEDNKRTDGRLLNERRDLSIDFGREDGYVNAPERHYSRNLISEFSNFEYKNYCILALAQTHH